MEGEKLDVVKAAQTSVNPNLIQFKDEERARGEVRLPVFKSLCPTEFSQVERAQLVLKEKKKELDCAKRERAPVEWYAEKIGRLLGSALFATLYYGGKAEIKIGEYIITNYQTAEVARLGFMASLNVQKMTLPTVSKTMKEAAKVQVATVKATA